MNRLENKFATSGYQIHFAHILSRANSYQDIRVAVSTAIGGKRAEGIERIGFVSGAIANVPEGPPEMRHKQIAENMRLMRECVQDLQSQYKFPIFAATDIFDIVWKELEETKLSPHERSVKMKELFRAILQSGVTDIYMMKEWRKSEGAIDEYETAQKLGITIHDLELNTQSGGDAGN